MSVGLKFRYAQRKDVSLILRFIKELAVYEKMLDDLSSLSGDKDKFTYTKLIYNNEIADKIAAYKAALICTSEEKETNNNGN